MGLLIFFSKSIVDNKRNAKNDTNNKISLVPFASREKGTDAFLFSQLERKQERGFLGKERVPEN